MLIYAYATAVISGRIKWSKIVSVFTPRIQESIKEKMLELLDDQALVDELTTTATAEQYPIYGVYEYATTLVY